MILAFSPELGFGERVSDLHENQFKEIFLSSIINQIVSPFYVDLYSSGKAWNNIKTKSRHISSLLQSLLGQ